MTKAQLEKEALSLPLEDRLLLAQKLTSDLDEIDSDLRAVLEARLEDLHANPDATISVEESHARIRRLLAERRAVA